MADAVRMQAAAEISYEEQLKAANEIVYKHGLELAIKNKTLSLLGKLYEIATLSLESAEMAKRVTEMIRQEFDFEIVGMLGYDGMNLLPLAQAASKRVSDLEAVGGSFHDAHGAIPASVIMRAVTTKRPAYTERIEDICGILISPELCRTLQKDSFIRSSFAYPLLGETDVKGVLLISLNRVSGDLGEYEREAMASFVNVIAITLEKVRLYEELKRANLQQENLLHFISHEIKGYLGKSAAAFAAIGEGDYGPVSEALSGMAATMLADVRKGVDTVMDILDGANMKKGTFTYRKLPFDFKQAVLESVKDLQSAAQDKKLNLSLTVGDGAYMLEGDEDKIRRHVLRNLIDNAIKYTPAGTIAVRLMRDKDAVRFEVEDSGVGITPEDMAHLFTEGGHGKDSIRINVHSTGYGLFIAKQVVVAHGGTITAQSKGSGSGSRFTVILPTS
ncbi:MAG: GAF domain-containing sensor histidine kinase [Patescibacteria group bacterium]|nr:GAF domain-containing sensor histidine kinase [Patescibacteria group bacterium]